jgi:hypothetical protein
MHKLKHRTYNVTYEELEDELIAEINILPIPLFTVDQSLCNTQITINALWDTGAFNARPHRFVQSAADSLIPSD